MKPFLTVLTLLFLLSPLSAQEWAIAIHGGAGADPSRMTEAQVKATEKGLRIALERGVKMLEEGAEALDVAQEVVAILEDDPAFNAGRGAVFNSEGEHELDAAIMDGSALSCGAVAGVRTVKNPIRLARLVMERTRHVLLAGDGAEKFATDTGVERVPNSYFSTQRRRDDWEKKHGTVGCVVRDRKGNLAAATSTGGLTDKKWGRVGDTPIIGAGTYADNRACAVSCTGTGEEYIRRAIAHDVAARMMYGGLALPEAAKASLASLPENAGGLISVDRDGHIVLLFNTPGMARGAADSSGRFETAIGVQTGAR